MHALGARWAEEGRGGEGRGGEGKGVYLIPRDVHFQPLTFWSRQICFFFFLRPFSETRVLEGREKGPLIIPI